MKYPKLKVKMINLMDESKTIRRLERKLKQQKDRARTTAHRASHHSDMMSLKDHRRGIVRYASRHTQLAYGFLRGVPYRSIEKSVRDGNAPNLKEIEKIAKRFGYPESNRSEIKVWLAA